MEPLAQGADRARWNVVELLTAVRLLGGAMLASIAAAVVLYAPDQVRELYRIAASDRNPAEIGLGLGSLAVMALVFWWVSYQIVQHCGSKVAADARVAQSVLAAAPAVIGILPIPAAALGMLASRPEKSIHAVSVGSPWEGLARRVYEQLDAGLVHGAIMTLLLAVVVLAAIVVIGVYRGDGRRHLQGPRKGYGFFSFFGLLISVGIVIAMTFATLKSPVELPQAIGTLPLVGLFFIAIMLMTGQMTVWQEMTGIPFLVVLAAFALTFAALDLNDNHEIRSTADKTRAASPEQLNRIPADAWSSFEAWYRARPDRQSYKTVYPVYVVAAQGGGIYAAQHAATLLARLQDLCPRFRHHLFAISSVSGGSLGAGVFAAVTKGLAAVPPGDPKSPPSPQPPSQQPGSPQAVSPQPAGATAVDETAQPSACPAVEQLASARVVNPKPGPHELATEKILSTDFLAPLAAGALFPDFTQRFLPFPVPVFDRARWLDVAFEDAWKAAAIPGANPLKESTLKLWSPQGSAPALLINATESDSGRRLLISPFLVEKNQTNAEMLQFPLWNKNLHGRFLSDFGGKTKFESRGPCQGRDIPLATAIGLSARFPWLTPAGSLTTDCNEAGKPVKTRIVDGGYFDNSGVDTAIDLIAQIVGKLEATSGKLDGPDGPRIAIHLIVLTTGEYPKRTGYAMGDGLEPIRALLSTRSARTPIAINGAKRRLAVLNKVAETSPETGLPKVQLPYIHEARFQDTIFRIPLGWRLSQASRDILGIQSGRFWDCDADAHHNQRKADLSNADCIQLMVYYQLEDSMQERLRVVSLGLASENLGLRGEMPAYRIDDFIKCYDSRLKTAAVEGREAIGLQPRQVTSIEAILRAASRPPWVRNEDWLAYVLALADRESGSLPLRAGRCMTEKCTIRQLTRWSTYAPHYKAQLAVEPNGNRYYERGYIQLAEVANYQRMQQVTALRVYDEPDLMLAPQVSASAMFAWLTNPKLSSGRTLDRYTAVDAQGRSTFDMPRALGEFMMGSGFAKLDTKNMRVKSMYRRALRQVQATNTMVKACLAESRIRKN
ncbi:MAG: hypothetical protein AB7O43_06535 [Hyphomicrobiaceae bacterium]